MDFVFCEVFFVVGLFCFPMLKKSVGRAGLHFFKEFYI